MRGLGRARTFESYELPGLCLLEFCWFESFESFVLFELFQAAGLCLFESWLFELCLFELWLFEMLKSCSF